MDKKYYAVKDKNFAHLLKWMTGQSYYKFDDVSGNVDKVYSFLNTPALKMAIEESMKLRNQIKEINK